MILPAAALLLGAQSRQAPQPPTPPPTPTPSLAPPAGPDAASEILVEGMRADEGKGRPAPGTRAGNSMQADATTVANRRKFEYSARIARCVGRGALSPPSRLAAAIDDAPNKASQVYAQDWLKRQYITCSEGSYASGLPPLPPNLGFSVYDRGAFVIEAIRRYAPDLALTPRETGDPAVHARFNTHEVPRNRFRYPLDHRFFATAVCLVRVQPQLSVRLVRTDDPAQIARLESAIVDRARVCVGGSERVYFDPTLFRIFIADAVYRWAVAARGVDSLVTGEPR